MTRELKEFKEFIGESQLPTPKSPLPMPDVLPPKADTRDSNSN